MIVHFLLALHWCLNNTGTLPQSITRVFRFCQSYFSSEFSSIAGYVSIIASVRSIGDLAFPAAVAVDPRFSVITRAVHSSPIPSTSSIRDFRPITCFPSSFRTRWVECLYSNSDMGESEPELRFDISVLRPSSSPRRLPRYPSRAALPGLCVARYIFCRLRASIALA
jgi:hypothetical protein